MITERAGRNVRIVRVTALGDVSRAQLTRIGGTGVFVSALPGGQVDPAAHSAKDLSVGPAQGVVLAAVSPRDDPWDALVAGMAPSSLTCRPGPGSAPTRRSGPCSCSRYGLTRGASNPR
jgi:hydroxymethylbilane synthase